MLITRFCCNTLAAVTRKEAPIIIDPDGDLEIAISIAGPSSSSKAAPLVLFRVSSSALRLASPKWKTLLSGSGPAANGAALKEPRLLFEEQAETIPTFTKVLNIAHHKYTPNKACLEYEVLVNEVSFCIRHETTELMRPWLESSVQAWLPKATRPGFEDWLIIAYGLRYRDIFEHLSCQVAAAVSRDDKDEKWVINRESSDSVNSNLILDEFPTAIRDNVLSRRSRVLESLLQTCYDCIEDLSSAKPKLYKCPEKRWTPTCASTTLGSLIRGFRNLGIWPQRPSAKDIKTSVNEFRASILAIEMSSHPAGPYYDVELTEASTDCPVAGNFRAAIMMSEIENEVPALTPACAEYLRTEREWAQPQLWMPVAEAEYGFHGADFMDVDMSDSEDSSYSEEMDLGCDDESEGEEMHEEENEMQNPGESSDSDSTEPICEGVKNGEGMRRKKDEDIGDDSTCIVIE